MKTPKTQAEKRCAEFLERRAPHLIHRSDNRTDAIDLVLGELDRRLPAVSGARIPSTHPNSKTGRALRVLASV